MAVLIIRKYLLALFLSSMCQHSTGQCQTNLTNMVVREGAVLKFSHPINRNCNWTLIPANSFFNMVQVAASCEKGVSPAFNGSLSADPSGLTIANASTSPAKNKTWSPAGLYMMLDKDAKCNVTAKVLIIKSGPTCQCNVTTKNAPADYSCSITYADSPVSAMHAQFTWSSAGGKDELKDVPWARKINRLEYQPTSLLPNKNRGRGKGKGVVSWTPKTCVVTFLAPAHGPFRSMAGNTPTFTGSCSFDSLKCN